ncbi:(2Fe-2S)-binding protein [Pedobacter yulinensis]|uniref:(2Fe-2S)-binding protein n=1 Tax=Pedobacter yulinensis TaxID=2126353 RepID=A0A2T3HMX9_9SPHI|nr:Rieske 2Fe-2S domain-containing protein [Pedobacter yulinensis]PST83789.1 (2Fe-2S)-binding protein [Pedobacter yulinensis]
MRWVRIMSKQELPDGDFVRCLKAEGRKLCLIRHEGKLYATQVTCPHAGGHFSGGWCEHGSLVCPIHRYSYSLETGRGAEGQGDYIDLYPTDMREDGVYAGFRVSWLGRLFGD